jgi:hypothetical protein
MIRAYPGHPSVQAGDMPTLHISGDEPRFRITIYRWADGSNPCGMAVGRAKFEA